MISMCLVSSLSFIVACRKDPLAITSYPEGPMVCETYFTEHAFLADTLTRTIGVESWGSVYLDLRPNRHSFQLSTQTTSHWPTPSSGEIFTYYVSIRAYSYDSVGVFLKQQHDPYRLLPFAIGDTLTPQHELSSDRPLYDRPLMGYSSFVYDHPVWYVGFVQIRDGRKHVGYLRIGSASSPDGRKYWLEGSRIAECPGEELIITAP